MYEEFGEIINTMKFNSYDYTENITTTLNALNARKNGKNYSLSDHICYNQACKILGKDARFEYAPSYFYLK